MTTNHQKALQSTFRFTGPGMDEVYGRAGNTPPAFGAPPGGQMSQTQPVSVSGVGERDKLAWGNTGQMRGFEVGSDYGGDTKARNSVKNTFGRIASRYGHAPGSIQQVMQDADFKKHFPNARYVPGTAGDKFDFGGVLSDFESGVPVGVIDVLEHADPTTNTSRGWQWLDESAGGAVPGGAVPSRGGQAAALPGQQSDLMSMILESLQQSQTDPQALLQQQF